jgi:hypothetical protein
MPPLCPSPAAPLGRRVSLRLRRMGPGKVGPSLGKAGARAAATPVFLQKR